MVTVTVLRFVLQLTMIFFLPRLGFRAEARVDGSSLLAHAELGMGEWFWQACQMSDVMRSKASIQGSRYGCKSPNSQLNITCVSCLRFTAFVCAVAGSDRLQGSRA